jgi:serine/threonine protein phosphatase PrpC
MAHDGGDRSRMQLAAYALTDRGRRRPQNQDNVLCYTLQDSKTPVGLYAVADGMGGQSAGEIASQIAIDTVREELGQFLENTVGATPSSGDAAITSRLVEKDVPEDAPNLSLVDALSGAMQRCNNRIREHGTQNPDTAGLGSTLTVVMVTGDLALVGNIGDSRTYILRDGTIRSLTQDHSLVGSLVRQGLITEDDVYKHPQRNLIYNALGTRPEANPDIAMHRLQSGDILLLCSDGLWEMVRDEDIRSIVESLSDPTAAAASLVEAANENGGVDNISVVVVRVQ